MCEIAAERAAVADLRVRDLPDRFMSKRVVCGDRRAGFYIRLRDERADTHSAGPGFNDIILVGQCVQVEQNRRLGQPEIHRRN